jgi:hypothetical protein
MKWYWVISCSNVVADPLVTDDDNFDGNEDEFVRGVPFQRGSKQLRLLVKKPRNDGTPDDALQNHLALPVISSRVQEAFLRNEIQGAEYVPVEVVRPNGLVVPGYSILNVLARRPALDRTRSDYDVYPQDYFLPQRRGQVSGVRVPVLMRSELASTDILRLDEYAHPLYVSERLKNIFEAERFSGWTFREIQVF